ncbi:MAG: STAS domain-containing protein [bacterium]|nr:STAS domain-containing protein [bacterium]
MKLKLHEENNVLIIEIKGKMMGGPEANDFHEALKTEIGKGFKKFILDLREVDWMNSSGLGMLIGGLTTIKNAGGELKLSSVTEKIHSLFVITKLVTIFESYDSMEKALESYR